MSDESLQPKIDQVRGKLEDMRTDVATLSATIQDCLVKAREWRAVREKANSDKIAIEIKGIAPLEAELRRLVEAENVRLREIAKAEREKQANEPKGPTVEEQLAAANSRIAELEGNSDKE